MSSRKKKSNRRRPPPRRSSPPPPPPHPILNLLPAATRSSLSSLSRQEMEALAYMITIVLVFDTSDPTPSSIKVKETFDNFPGNKAAQKSPIFGCQCFPCYRTYWERWVSTSSSNRRCIDVAIEAFDKSLQSWKNGNANSMGNTANSGRKDERCSGGSLPALEEVVEERSDKETQDSAMDSSAEEGTHRSFAGNVIAFLLDFLNSRMRSLWSRKV